MVNLSNGAAKRAEDSQNKEKVNDYHEVIMPQKRKIQNWRTKWQESLEVGLSRRKWDKKLVF